MWIRLARCMAVAAWSANAAAQAPEAYFHSTDRTGKTKFDARAEPAQVSTETPNALMDRSYGQIGTVQITTMHRCEEKDDSRCKPVADIDPVAAILRKAASEGGELVVLIANNKLKATRYPAECAKHDVSNPYWYKPPTGAAPYAKVDRGGCQQWVRKAAEKDYITEGSVWRLDPAIGRANEFFRAVARGDLAAVREGLAQGFDPKLAHRGQRPLSAAAGGGHLAIVRLLVESGADVNARVSNGSPALITAAAAGHGEVLQFLLAQGADVNVTGYWRRTALHAAARAGHLEIVRMLLARGASVNVTASGGETPLMYAAGGGHAAIVEMLRQAGAQK